ncbi:MAG: response regulator transcription factor [Hyphomicrobiaceae bacterium]
MYLLVMEADPRSGPLLRGHLTRAGHTVDLVTTIDAFRHQAASEAHDLYVVELDLPDGDGLDIIRQCRQRKSRVPILVVTARSSIDDRVKGLDCGADDYLVKPCHAAELLARVRALARRPATTAVTNYSAGKMTVDLDSGQVRVGKVPVWLTPAESRLLTLLVRRVGATVSKSAICSQVYGGEAAPSPNAIEQLVSRLRRSLAQAGLGVEVKTIRGIGYVLEESAVAARE